MKKTLLTAIIASLFIIGSFIPAMASSRDHQSDRYTLDYEKKFYIISNYGRTIAKASNAFGIPQEVLVNLITMTSGGDPLATGNRTGLSGAKGLMLVNEDIFDQACTELKAVGLSLSNDPFDPETAIFAGAWYLDQIYQNSVDTIESFPFDRQNVRDWESALAFYTARITTIRPPSMGFDKGFE